MAPPRTLMAVDVGTAAARAGLFDAGGGLITAASAPFELRRPQAHHAVYVMDEIWQAVADAVRRCVATEPDAAALVAGLAFDATSSLVLNHRGAMPLDGPGDVFCWMDHRGEAEADEITATGDRLLRVMGGSLSPEMHLPKLLWLRRRDPAAWARLTGARDLCDELARRATGVELHSLCGLACKWAYLPHGGEGWRRALLEQIGLADLAELGSLIHEPRPVGSLHGHLTAAAAHKFGLPEQIPVAVGLIDAEAGTLGTLGHGFAGKMNEVAAVIGGTSTCLMAFAPEQRPIPGVWGPFYGAVFPGLWLHEAGQSLSGAALDAVLAQHPAGPRRVDHALHAETSAEILAMLDREGDGFASDRHIVPDWLGNRSPLGDGRVRALMTGIGTEDRYEDFLAVYYATARALVLQLRHVIEHMNHHGYAIRQVALSGGHLRNNLMRRLYRDALAARLITVRAPEPMLLGTAMVAATAAGLHGDLLRTAEAMAAPEQTVAADPAARSAHDRAYRTYRQLFAVRNALAT